ncbi:hypothetical protein NA57DRAFT_78517 [Rhizodiscina lignyota]|uniref:C3H1-type domain-containing protein n=1 Tax=Rhizodiscina lignyota TaxID=1504668 RepID=A0A9P4M4I5_9PEZI|nr:hypothetical protein NA57DRAFT_78517 [Rhizodiscina lignyota]
MSEDEDLKRRIASLAGRINQDKRRESGQQPSYGYHGNWAPQRGTPYGIRRAGRGHYHQPSFRNRTLVLKNGDSGNDPELATDPSETDNLGETEPSWVTKHDRHLQLINTEVYDKITQQRTKDMQETRTARKKADDAKELASLGDHFANTAGDLGNQREQRQEININGVRFRVQDGGSKLIRASGPSSALSLNISADCLDDPNSIRLVPRGHTIAGVTFYRSKNGNLYRSGLVKAETKKPKAKSTELCPVFTTTGSCLNGPNCRFTHDPNKVAICKDFLAKGSCPHGDNCDLSHDPTPNRVPACIHFLRGNCTNDDCRYAHVKVNPGAPVCRQFATLGYCEKGVACDERHVKECPDYANKGACHKKSCQLPHVDRAGQLRKAASAQVSEGNDDRTSDPSSDEEDISEDIDSDEDILIQGVDGAGQDLAGNADYIPL